MPKRTIDIYALTTRQIGLMIAALETFVPGGIELTPYYPIEIRELIEGLEEILELPGHASATIEVMI